MTLRLTGLQCRRAILSPVFAVAVTVFGLAMVVNSAEVVKGAYPSVVSAFDLSVAGMADFCFVILPVLPFALSYGDERVERSLKFNYIRAGVWDYFLAKYLAVLVSGFLVVVLGYCLFFGIMRIRFPLNTVGSLGTSAASFLADAGRSGIYLLIMTLNYGLSGALFAGLAFTFSVFIRVRFVTVLLPYVVFDLLNHLNAVIIGVLGVNYSRFDPTSWMLYTVAANSPVGMLGKKALYISVVLLAAFCIAYARAERRELND
ncbi:MAG: hypothetical protein E7460_09715 [Ruminococcaceae bacterium]|nr:hypothetical protein [Oscillospiraceae bacterium]